MQNKTSVDEKEPNEALQVKRSTSEFGDFSSKACFILVRNFPIFQNSEILLKNGVFIDKLFFMSDTKDLCPCGSGKLYSECCEPIIKGSAKAPTAEALMRSRYSAYVKHEIDHIAKSCVQDPDKNEIDMEETRRWSEESTWHGLKILRTEKGKENDKEGIVEFSATYTRGGLKDVHLEKAKFVKKDGEWVYHSGSLIPTTIVRDGAKVGRNDPCPCGSGLKYKRCCGR